MGMSDRFGFIKKKSAFSVQETMDNLESTIKDRGIAVFARINHTRNAVDVGMSMNYAQVISFGNPALGTILMQKNVFLALDLPLRIAVVEDDVGDVWAVYTTTDVLKTRYAFPESEVLTKVDALLDAVTDVATK